MMKIRLLVGVIALPTLLTVACGGNDDKSSATPTPAATVSTASSPATPAPKKFIGEKFLYGLTVTADDTWSINLDEEDWFVLKQVGDTSYPADLSK